MSRTRDVSNILKQPFTVTLGTSNYRAGVNAGNSILSGGTLNTVIGDEAGTAITTGDENTLVGYVSGDAITTGIRNVAVGSYALSTNVAGDQSVAVGHGALFSQNPSTNADMNNTAVGHDAGNQVTTGTNNTFVGGLAGDATDDGNDNVAIGHQALSANAGDDNVAIGKDALLVNVKNQNIAIGSHALDADVNGGTSVAIGHNALSAQAPATATDMHNVAVGNSAGMSVTTGISNTLIGARNGDGLSEGNYNVAVGDEALGTDTKGSNSVCMGQGALLNQNFTTATAVYNTAIGHAAGNQITTGKHNTIVGGLAADNMTTGNENTIIGYNHTSTATGTQCIMIGSQNGSSSTSVFNEIVMGRAASGSGANTFTIGFGDTDVQISVDGSDTSWSATSDERLKDNINSLSVGLDFINELRPVTYEWKKKKDVDESLVVDGKTVQSKYYEEDSTEPCRGDGGIHYGLIAQEIKTTIDKYNLTGNHHIWKEGVDGFQVVGVGNVMPILINAVKELSTALDAAVARIKTLEDG